MSRAAVMGAGSWGTAFAQLLADAGGDVVIWGRDANVVDAINDQHENPAFHPGYRLPTAVTCHHRRNAALDGADLVVLAIPSQVLRPALARWNGPTR